jgi:5-(hydroxymethyl)furfural/furfural oxidase
VGGLRVVDASIFPTIPSAGTHLSVLMVAEKIADQIKAEWQEERSSRGLTA